MLTTEKESAEKWCSETSISTGGPAENRLVNSIAGFNCLGSRCMKWRWGEALTPAKTITAPNQSATTIEDSGVYSSDLLDKLNSSSSRKDAARDIEIAIQKFLGTYQVTSWDDLWFVPHDPATGAYAHFVDEYSVEKNKEARRGEDIAASRANRIISKNNLSHVRHARREKLIGFDHRYIEIVSPDAFHSGAFP